MKPGIDWVPCLLARRTQTSPSPFRVWEPPLETSILCHTYGRFGARPPERGGGGEGGV